MSLELIIDFIDKKRSALSGDIDSLLTLSKHSPSQKIADLLNQSVSDSVLAKLAEGPLGQLGKDFIAEQIAKNGAKIINNVDSAVKSAVKKPVEQIQSLVFDSMTSVLTAKNDLAMYFIQQQAKQVIIAIDKKRSIALDLQEKIRELYNILVLITSTQPFFDTYLNQLRQALIKVYEARNALQVVHNTLQVNDRWLKVRYKEAQDMLHQAEALLEPQGPEPDVKFTDSGLLSGVGIPSQPQQLALLLSLPQKIKEVLAAANGYFVATMKVNVLLLAFIQAYGAFTNSSSRKLKQFTLNTLENIINEMDELISGMATQLNGSPSSILRPDTVNVFSPSPETIEAARTGGNIGMTDPSLFSGPMTSRQYRPDAVKTSSSALGWLIDIKSILAYMELVPGPTLEALDTSNDALARYNRAVETIKKKGNRQEGDAILIAVEGREDPGQMERQLTTFLLTAAKAVYDPGVARAILPLGRTLIKRIDLTLIQDQEIMLAVREFAEADLAFPSAVKSLGDNVFKMLDKFGLDRAADFLRNGKFADFFNMDGKTATYAGAAITAFSVLKECLTTEEEREQLTQAQREVERELKSKELIGQRSASTGFQQQVEEVKIEDIRLERLSERAQISGKKCGLPDDFMPANLMKSIGPVVGVSVLGGSGLTDKLTKIGRGIL